MKKSFTVLIVALFTATAWAQSPQKMSYQAVIRNNSNALVSNTQIGMEINIRQGSAFGTIVYTETQTPVTNGNGLVSIEIGSGAGFSTIDWASGSYFIETRTAVVPPLTTYTIIGVSEFLSVPYALHAKTAETFIGTITETDPLYTAKFDVTGSANGDLLKYDGVKFVKFTPNYSETTHIHSNATTTVSGFMSNPDKTKLDNIASGAEVNVQADWNQATITSDDFIKNKPIIPAAADGSETKITAGTNVTVTGIGTNTNPYVINTMGSSTHAIGESYQGGIIFWLDATGQHGLIASTFDQSFTPWYNGTYRYTGTTGDGLYAGAMNTAMIVATQLTDNQTGSFAAKVCADYSVIAGGINYGDWYLPSKYELNLLYLQRTVVGNFTTSYYWSSSEYSNTNALRQIFGDGSLWADYKNDPAYVRAIRAF